MDDKTINGDNNWEEIEIPVPWGHISAKWWGPRGVQPIIAVHGWQDNAGTFDLLAPLLVDRGHTLLCIDLPGHGFSSHLPPGQHYHLFWDGIPIIRRIVKQFNWTNITLMGHSMGGGIVFMYAATYPNDVKRYITFDIASPCVRPADKNASALGDAIDRHLKYEKLPESSIPSYIYSEMIDTAMDGYGPAITRASTMILMRRGMRPVPEKPGYYRYTRDSRLKAALLGFSTNDLVVALAKQITCETLCVIARDGSKFYGQDHYDILDVIGEGAKRVVRHEVDGTHFVHLNTPDVLIDAVHAFLIS